MARMTIAQLREREVVRLANRTYTSLELARKTMNRYYRLCGLDERLLYLENDERTCNSRYTQELEEKRERWFKSLNETLQNEFNAHLVYFGYFPTICEAGSTATAVNAYFYH